MRECLSLIRDRYTPDAKTFLRAELGAFFPSDGLWASHRATFEAKKGQGAGRAGQSVLAGSFGFLSRACAVALTLISVTPSEACVERAFSQLGLLHSDVRNKLSPESIDALMFVRMNWPGRKPGARKSLRSLLDPPSEPEDDVNAEPEPPVAENEAAAEPDGETSESSAEERVHRDDLLFGLVLWGAEQ